MARHSWMRFSLATLLFIVFCIGGFFAGYRTGVQFLQNDVSMYVRTYSVDDLLTGTEHRGLNNFPIFRLGGWLDDVIPQR